LGSLQFLAEIWRNLAKKEIWHKFDLNEKHGHGSIEKLLFHLPIHLFKTHL
jgi:hypothetical protein